MTERVPERYELRFPVAPGDIDELGHVNNTVYVRWVQDAAIAHWRASAPADAQATLVWVVARHEIDYKHPAVLGDQILARTWVGPASRLAFERKLVRYIKIQKDIFVRIQPCLQYVQFDFFYVQLLHYDTHERILIIHIKNRAE